MQHCSGIARLAQLCTDSMVRDVSMLLGFIANNGLPDVLIVELMKSALVNQRDRAIDVLITYWPYRVLDIKTLLPPVSVTLTTLQSICGLVTDRHRILKATEYLVHAFVKGIKAGNLYKLRFLNIASYPIGEETSNLLCRFCLTWKPTDIARPTDVRPTDVARPTDVVRPTDVARLTDVVRQTDVVSCQQQDEHQRSMDIDPDSQHDNNQYMVKFDNVASANDAINNVRCQMQALKHSNSTKPRPFRIFIEHMTMSTHPPNWIIRLMKYIDKKVLLKLTISLIPLMNEGLISIVPMLTSYTSLTMLDISYNCLSLSSAHPATESLKVILQKLENLVSLNLSSNRIRGLLSTLLACVQCPLQCLWLSGCWLSEADIVSLASSGHMFSIQELDLSYNSAVGKVGMQTMLNNSVSLKSLNLSGCKLKPHWLVSDMIDKLENMPELDILNLSDNEIANNVVYYSLIQSFIRNRIFGQLYLDIPEAEEVVLEEADLQRKLNKIQRLLIQADWSYSISEWLVIHKNVLL